jgi:hypothetical protein
MRVTGIAWSEMKGIAGVKGLDDDDDHLPLPHISFYYPTNQFGI